MHENQKPSYFDGVIDRINIDRGFGFATCPNEPDIFFHRYGLQSPLEFDEQLTGRRVRIAAFPDSRGWRATKVWPAD